jgi:putative intracellular protease/amidase
MKSLLVLLAVAGAAGPCVAAPAKPYTRNVAIVIYDNAEPLDWTGPYEVYNDAASFGSANGLRAFNVYVVSKTKDAVNSQGMWVVPGYSIADAPKPDIVLFPGGPSNKIYDDPEWFAWAKKACDEAEIAQSVCTGAFVLGKAGLLDGLEVTTHYGSIDRLGEMYPKAQVKRGRRFVDNGHVVTTAGISAGIDGSLHVVARLLGRKVADEVARYMEYAWFPRRRSRSGTPTSTRAPTTWGGSRRAATCNTTRSATPTRPRRSRRCSRTTRRTRTRGPTSAGACAGWTGTSSRRRRSRRPPRPPTGRTARTRTTTRPVSSRSRGGRTTRFAELRSAYAKGYPQKDAIEKDKNLASLKDDPRAKTLTASAN